MADRFPLIANSSANQIQEIASGDQLNLSGNNIANAGVVTATTFSGSGASLTNLNGSNIASGTVPVARIGTGTKSTSTFYRGDGTFQVVNTDLVADTSPQLGGDLASNGSDIKFANNDKAIFGTGNDAAIYHNDTDFHIDAQASGATRGIYITAGTVSSPFIELRTDNGESMLKCLPDDGVYLYHNNNLKLRTTSAGTELRGDVHFDNHTNTGKDIYWDESNDRLSFNDNVHATFGNGEDLRIYHDGTDNIFQSNGLKNFIFKPKDTDIGLKILGDGAVELYNDNALKLATTSSGVAITGQAVATGNSAKFQAVESGGATVEIRCGGSESYIGNQTNHKISFITNGNRTMTLLPGKNLCIGLKGTTGDTSPTTTIGWNLTDGWTMGVFSGGTGSNTPWTLYNEHSSYNRYMAYIRFDGGVMSHQSNDGNLCDERIKQDFGTVSSQWDNIKNIGLKTFRYKNEPSNAKLKVGVIAQQVETIYPDLVDEDWPIGDANPNTHQKNSGDFYKSVKEEQLQMYTLKALQEAMARIETLETEVAALKGS